MPAGGLPEPGHQGEHVGLLTAAEVEDGVRRLRADLASGRWEDRHGSLRTLPDYDTGHRLIIAG